MFFRKKRKEKTCPRCDGTGWDGCHNHTPDYDNLPMMLKPIGMWRCELCGGTGKIPIPLTPFDLEDSELEEFQKIVEKLEKNGRGVLEDENNE